MYHLIPPSSHLFPSPHNFDKSLPHTPLTIQSIISSARVRELTCSFQYTLRHAYIAASPPINWNFPKSKTAAFPMYASEPRWKYLKGLETSSSVIRGSWEGVEAGVGVDWCVEMLPPCFSRARASL